MQIVNSTPTIESILKLKETPIHTTDPIQNITHTLPKIAHGVPPTFAGLEPRNAPNVTNNTVQSSSSSSSLNAHLAAMIRQYDVFAKNAKNKPAPINSIELSPPQPLKPTVIRPIAVNGTACIGKPLMPNQQLLPMPSTTLSGSPHNTQFPFPNYPHLPGYGWPFPPFVNPFMPYVLSPLQLSLLQNQLGINSLTTRTSAQQPNLDNSNKRKATSPLPVDTRSKRVKEIEKDVYQMNLHQTTQPQAIMAFQFKSD
ncbi:uncharacterized protein CELE_R07A4.3 [Caenorhabditis elegans]|uniref:Uncharacterized protein n=1 Tax=Caenorhabditis elegans TaxID=6239 RepID=Q21781_CAEEL|nr:Uncharacterized protein CELE_R07A4.3 [Caenorhabditis elegans]CAA91763.2 Uncharacterized protein CELE_R07A4.3 [Caenorhabditis elegans]|eukprot:NP_509798.2 Uncharacterized protein CELE_R07A4.3 [Caenorhabditis elegans]